MLLFGNLMISPLIKSLRELPELLSLQDFSDRLSALLKDLHHRPPSSLMNHMDNIQETHDLWIPQPDGGVSLRTLRHMIYQHDCIKNNLSKEGKEIMLNHQVRMKILLSKRLCHLRLGKEVREKIISNENTEELEVLLAQTNHQLKDELISNLTNVLAFSRSTSSRHQMGLDSEIGSQETHQPTRRGQDSSSHSSGPTPHAAPYQQHYRAFLGQANIALEWENEAPPITHPADIQQATETLLEVLFEIKKNSSLSLCITSQIKSHVAESQRRTEDSRKDKT